MSRIREGEKVPAPCRHCASVSLTVTVKAGVQMLRCPKCNAKSRVRVRPESEDGSIAFEAATRESDGNATSGS